MPFQIRIEPSGHSFEAAADQSILQAALDAGLHLPYGCRNGACGACKGRVLAGEFDPGNAQDGTLTADEVARGMALYCCARPRSAMTIECREVGALRDIPVRTLPCRVQKMERLATDVMLLHLQLPANERLQFLAGQYIDILMKDGRRRAFSLANAPHDDAVLQLHLRHVPGGAFTDHVFTTMKERDILRIDGPHGTFFLREDSARPVVFVAGGTGFAPIKAMVEHALHQRIARPMTLYWGARTPPDLYMAGLAAGWAREHEHLRFIPVLSEVRPEHGWSGRTGLVHRAVMEDFPDLSGHQVYACGVPAMIEAARGDFTARCGLPAEEFFADAFTYAKNAGAGG
ncbi:MAG: CDP-6-deoxy-delta-3,4-glucoseen reductase [Betaproteobacteria bacterium]|nr:CDP-6-deoxy-delta-3,4-glucoseen reductase [Betaproteobacteria bacterium]